MTPNDTIKPENESTVRRSLKKHVVYSRAYPEIQVGDTVRIYTKKHIFDKQQISVCTINRYIVEERIR